MLLAGLDGEVTGASGATVVRTDAPDVVSGVMTLHTPGAVRAHATQNRSR